MYARGSLVPRLSPRATSDGKLGGAWERGYACGGVLEIGCVHLSVKTSTKHRRRGEVGGGSRVGGVGEGRRGRV